jgi:HSP20 family protein
MEEKVMNLMRWEPFKETDEFFRNLSTPMFGRWPQLLGENAGMKIEWSPAVDIKETEKEYLVTAELPGLKREDVKVTLDEGVLTIEGERSQEKVELSEKTHRTERFYGTFCRSFTLPEYTDAVGIRAESKDGVLRVHVPKLKVEKRKALEIKVE